MNASRPTIVDRRTSRETLSPSCAGHSPVLCRSRAHVSLAALSAQSTSSVARYEAVLFFESAAVGGIAVEGSLVAQLR